MPKTPVFGAINAEIYRNFTNFTLIEVRNKLVEPLRFTLIEMMSLGRMIMPPAQAKQQFYLGSDEVRRLGVSEEFSLDSRIPGKPRAAGTAAR